MHIAKSFIDARVQGLLEKGGGHAMAGGFTVAPDKVEDLYKFLNDHIMRQMESSDTNVETIIDGSMTIAGINTALVEMLQNKVGPFGQEQPEPVFMLKNIKVHKVDVLGGSHIRVMMGDWEGGSRVKAMAFRSVDTPLGEALLKHRAQGYHILGQLKINEWQGRKTAEMHIVDAAYAS